MKTLTIKNLIKFREKSDKGKKFFAQSLKLGQVQEELEGGGNYWAICLSAIGNSFKNNDAQWVSDKIDEFEDVMKMTEYERTRIMYKRNLDILRRFEDFNFDKLRPSENFKIVTQSRFQHIMPIYGLPIKVNPSYVFTFGDKDAKSVGTIWFVAQLGGFREEELAMYSDAAHSYLKTHYSRYVIDPKYCMVMDLFSGEVINYSQILAEKVQRVLNSTTKEIVKLMK
jgi:hypothetical protein